MSSRFPRTITITDPRNGITRPIKVRFEAELKLDANTERTLRKVSILDEQGKSLGEEWINKHAKPIKANALPLAKSHTNAPALVTIEVAFYVTTALF